MRRPTTDPSRSRCGVFLTLCVLVAPLAAPPAVVAQSELTYVEETDPLVRQKLEAWQDLKLGLLMHWVSSNRGLSAPKTWGGVSVP
jgi:hypothetical protein